MSKIEINKETLTHYYIDLNLTAKECSKIFDCTIDKIYYWRNMFNIIKDKKLVGASRRRSHLESNKNKKHTLDELKLLIPLDKFTKYFFDENHTMDECLDAWNIEKSEFYRLQREYNIYKTQSQAKAAGLRTSGSLTIAKAIELAPKELFYDYYVKQNHTTNETIEHFGITAGLFIQLQLKYNIHKEKYQQVELTLQTKGCESLIDVLNRISIDDFKKDYYNKVSLANLMIKYSIKSCVVFDSLLKTLNLPKRKNLGTSSINFDFGYSLKEHNIDYKTEYHLFYNLPKKNYYKYDFYIPENKTFIELNPTSTHNVLWSPFGDKHDTHIDCKYHFNKTITALGNGYKCITVWDWDDKNKILNYLKNNKKYINTNKCLYSIIDNDKAEKFLNKYSLIKISYDNVLNIGAYYKNSLIAVISLTVINDTYQLINFGNNPYYELSDKYQSLIDFTKGYLNIATITAKLDISKYSIYDLTDGNYKIKNYIDPELHWSNWRKNIHIKDSDLQKLTISKFLKIKNCSDNYKYDMIKNKFLPVYDCGYTIIELY